MPDDLHQHKDTPKDALLSALAESEAVDPFKEVLVVYNTRSGKSGSFDSGLTSSEAGYLCLLFLIWTANANMGVVMGNVKRDLFAHVGFKDPEEGTDDGQTGREAD
jgi:hypothetical protein